jgi:hypothetical protein
LRPVLLAECALVCSKGALAHPLLLSLHHTPLHVRPPVKENHMFSLCYRFGKNILVLWNRNHRNRNFCLSGSGTVMHSSSGFASGSGFRSRSNIKWNTK